MKTGCESAGTATDSANCGNGGRKGAPGGLTEWAAEINRFFAQGASSTLALARVVAAARGSLARGQWTALWSSGRIPFSKRKAEMLVVVGMKMSWVTAQTFAHLPHGWSVLYQLAHLPKDILEQSIENGRVHSALSLREARTLVAEFHGRPLPRRTGRTGIRSHLLRLSRFVRQTLGEWSAADRLYATAQLKNLLEEVTVDSNGSDGKTERRVHPIFNAVSLWDAQLLTL